MCLCNPEKTEVWLDSFTKNILWACLMVSQTLNTVKSTVKFVQISRPDPRDPNFNREESSHCSPYHPHDAHASGTPTTF